MIFSIVSVLTSVEVFGLKVEVQQYVSVAFHCELMCDVFCHSIFRKAENVTFS